MVVIVSWKSHQAMVEAQSHHEVMVQTELARKAAM